MPRRSLAWHYQWLIVNEFLSGLVGAGLIAEIETSGPRFYRPAGEPFIPVEFADAAYRYGIPRSVSTRSKFESPLMLSSSRVRTAAGK